MVPTVRPSAYTSIFAPTRCGVEPVDATMVTSATSSPSLQGGIERGKDFLVHAPIIRGSRVGGCEGVSEEPVSHRDAENTLKTQLTSVTSAPLWCRRRGAVVTVERGPRRVVTSGAVRSTPPVRCRRRTLSVIVRGQPGSASLPVSRSISAKVMPSGAFERRRSACPASAVFMNSVQIGSAACAAGQRRAAGCRRSRPTPRSAVPA